MLRKRLHHDYRNRLSLLTGHDKLFCVLITSRYCFLIVAEWWHSYSWYHLFVCVVTDDCALKHYSS